MAKTSTSARDGAPAELQTLAQRLKTWRATRPRGRRISDELWRAAADLARIHGLSRTATALKLSYYDLRRRLQAGAARDSRRRRPPVFVEVPGPAAATRRRRARYRRAGRRVRSPPHPASAGRRPRQAAARGGIVPAAPRFRVAGSRSRCVRRGSGCSPTANSATWSAGA